MQTQLTCECGKQLQVEARHAGKRAKCPACGALPRIPNRVAQHPLAGLLEEDPEASQAARERVREEREAMSRLRKVQPVWELADAPPDYRDSSIKDLCMIVIGAIAIFIAVGGLIRLGGDGAAHNVVACSDLASGEWSEFVDAGGRFRCQTPSSCRPEQIESQGRSKVQITVPGGDRISIIVRATNYHEVGELELDQLVTEMSADLRRIGAVKSEVLQRQVGRIDGTTSLDVAMKVTHGRFEVEMRGIKYKKHGYDHSLTLMGSSGTLERWNTCLERLLTTYESIDPPAAQGRPGS